MLSHANPSLLGRDLKGDLGVDVAGYRFGDLILSATEDGLWWITSLKTWLPEIRNTSTPG